MARVDTGKPRWAGSRKSRQQLGTQEGRESSGSLSCSWKHTAGMTTNDGYRKAEITFLADFLHHRFGKLSVFFFHPHPWQYYLCRQYQCDRVFSMEATVRKSDFIENGSAISLTWRSAFQCALKFRPPDSPVFPISRKAVRLTNRSPQCFWRQKDSATHGIAFIRWTASLKCHLAPLLRNL